MFAVTGITGQVGGHVARTLMTAGRQVRAIVRDPRKGRWLGEPGVQRGGCRRRRPCRSHRGVPGYARGVHFASTDFRSVPRFPRGQSCHRRRAGRHRIGPPRARGLPLDHRCSCGAGEPAHPTDPAGAGLANAPVPVTFLAPDGSWKTAPGTLPRRGTAGSCGVSCNRSADQSPWCQWPTWDGLPPNSSKRCGLASGWSSWRVPRVSPNDIAAAFSELFGQPRPGRGCAAGHMAGDVHRPRHEEPLTADADARWV